MNTATAELRSRDPVRLDNIVRYAGGAAHRSARKDKQYADALHISRQRGTAHRNGDPNSELVHVLTTFRKLARHPDTTAVPLLAEAWAQVMSEQVEQLDNDALRRLHEELTERDYDVEAANRRATMRLKAESSPDDHEAAADTDMEKGELVILRAQVRREIAKRQRDGGWL